MSALRQNLGQGRLDSGGRQPIQSVTGVQKGQTAVPPGVCRSCGQPWGAPGSYEPLMLPWGSWFVGMGRE